MSREEKRREENRRLGGKESYIEGAWARKMIMVGDSRTPLNPKEKWSYFEQEIELFIDEMKREIMLNGYRTPQRREKSKQ